MRSFAFLVCVMCLAGCKKDTPVAPPAPKAPETKPETITVEGAFHAVKCGGVTALWSGNADTMPAGSPKSFGAESLAFRFSDGTTLGFKPTGQLFFSDWTFDVFSPDCAYTALLVDHFGPVHFVETTQLRAYLEGRLPPTLPQLPKSDEAAVVSQQQWSSPSQLEFVTSCCGGAQVFRADAKDGAVKKMFEAKEAPKGVRRGAAGWEVVP